MSQTNAETVQDTPLTIREHLDPDKHWIGETLAPPTQSEIAATVGITSGPGDSPFVARADHLHKIDPTLLPVAISWTPSWTNFTRGTSHTETSFAYSLRATSGVRIVFVQYNLQLGSGTPGPTGDSNLNLPVTASNRICIYGVAEGSLRINLIWHTIVANGVNALVRPLSYRPTNATAVMPVENSAQNLNTVPMTWAAGDWLQFNGMYYTTY